MTPLGYALLSLLARGPATGYELTRQMKRPVGYFWEAGHGQIYPELARLEAAQLVKHRVVAQDTRPNKKIVSLTAKGRSTLVAWLSVPPEERGVRNELLLKTYSIWLLEPPRALEMLGHVLADFRATVAGLEEARSALTVRAGAKLSDMNNPEFASMAALEAGLAIKRGYVTWCTWLIDQISTQSR